MLPVDKIKKCGIGRHFIVSPGASKSCARGKGNGSELFFRFRESDHFAALKSIFGRKSGYQQQTKGIHVRIKELFMKMVMAKARLGACIFEKVYILTPGHQPLYLLLNPAEIETGSRSFGLGGLKSPGESDSNTLTLPD